MTSRVGTFMQTLGPPRNYQVQQTYQHAVINPMTNRCKFKHTIRNLPRDESLDQTATAFLVGRKHGRQGKNGERSHNGFHSQFFLASSKLRVIRLARRRAGGDESKKNGRYLVERVCKPVFKTETMAETQSGPLRRLGWTQTQARQPDPTTDDREN